MALEGVVGVDTVPAGSAASGATEPAGHASSGSTSASTGSAGSPAPASKWEDDPRAKGMLADLQRERRARQEFERKVTEAETRAAERDRQIAALTNSRAPSTEELDAQAVRDRFNQLYPHLGELTPEDIKALRELRAQQGQVQQAIDRQWSDHSKRMLDSVFAKISETEGELSPQQRRAITALYVADAEAYPEFMPRHDAGDKTLVDEFVKAYIENHVEPVRRRAVANEVTRHRAVPSGGNRTLPGGKTVDIKDLVKDDKATMDFIMESRKGQFKR